MDQLRRLIAGIGFLALLAMVGVALTDIVLRLISRLPGTPFAKVIPVAVPGVVDWVELTLVTVAHLSVAVTFMVGSHVTVDVVANLLPAERPRGHPAGRLGAQLRFHGAVLLHRARPGAAAVSATAWCRRRSACRCGGTGSRS